MVTLSWSLFVKKSQSDCERNKSIYNKDHVNWIYTLIFNLTSSRKVTGDQIFIVTPYDADYHDHSGVICLLAEEYRGVPSIKDVRVAKVDAIQGAEADVIIANFPSTRRSGFMKHPGCLNSMLSRAKFAQYLVANAESMCGWKPSSRDSFLPRYIDRIAHMQVPSSKYHPKH